MSTTPQLITNRTPFIGFTLRDTWRTIRMWDSLIFLIGLPIALYLMFGVAPGVVDQQAGEGNIGSYIVTSMAVYGAVMATTTVASMAGLERQQGWTRQLALTGFSTSSYLVSKLVQAVVIAMLPTIALFVFGYLTGARFGSTADMFATAGLVVVCAFPFVFMGWLL